MGNSVRVTDCIVVLNGRVDCALEWHLVSRSLLFACDLADAINNGNILLFALKTN